MTIKLPPAYGDHPTCQYCQTMFSHADMYRLEYQGLMQIEEGKDAHDIVDVTYTCPGCGIKHVVRFRRPLETQ